MNVPLSNTLLAGDPRLVDHIVGEVKSQGIFDRFRKECIADVDTKPAYQNLGTRVEGSVNSFLKSQVWKPDMNKNQLRESLRKHILETSFLDVGVERIVDQVVNPKVYSVFMPQIEDVVYKFLGIERPKSREKNGSCNLKDLLPKDLDPVSPESDKNSLKDESLESMDTSSDNVKDREGNPATENKLKVEIIEGTNKPDVNGRAEVKQEPEIPERIGDDKMERDCKKFENSVKKTEENPILERSKKIDEIENNPEDAVKSTEYFGNCQFSADDNSVDDSDKQKSQLTSTSLLNTSFKSDEKTEEEEESPQFEPIDIMNFNESNHSNDSHLSGISELTSHRSQSPICINDLSRDQFDLSNQDQDSQLSKVSSNSRLSIVTDFGYSNQASTSAITNINEDSKDKCSKDYSKTIKDVDEVRAIETKFHFDSIKKEISDITKKDSKIITLRENNRENGDESSREKNENKDGKEKSESKDNKESSESRDERRKHRSSSSKLKSSKDSRSDSKDSRRHRDRKRQSSSSSRHSKSKRDKDQSSHEDLEKSVTDSSSKPREEKNKEKEDKSEKDERKGKEERREREKDERKDKEKDERKEREKDERKEKEKDEKREIEKQSAVQETGKDLKDIYKEKIREIREKKELTEKEKLNKDLKQSSKDTKEKVEASREGKEHRRDHHKSSKSLSDRQEKSSKKSGDSKDRKRDDSHSKERKSHDSKSDKEQQSRKEEKKNRSDSRKEKSENQSSKDKKQRDSRKSKLKDDHSSLRKKSNERRSTDRDGSNGSSSKSSHKNSSLGKHNPTIGTKETSKTNNSTDEASDRIEDSQNNYSKSLEFSHSKIDINPTIDESLNSEVRKFSEIHDSSNNKILVSSRKRTYEESSLSSYSEDRKIKKHKSTDNTHDAKIQTKNQKKTEIQNKERNSHFDVKRIKIENEGNSNSPFSVEDISKVPDEERVQIIEVADEEGEESYDDELQTMNLDETSIIFGGEINLQSARKKESKLSLMERSIRESLDELISDHKLIRNNNDAKMGRSFSKEIEMRVAPELDEVVGGIKRKNNENVNQKDNCQVVSRDEQNNAVEETLERKEKDLWRIKVLSEKDDSRGLENSTHIRFTNLDIVSAREGEFSTDDREHSQDKQYLMSSLRNKERHSNRKLKIRNEGRNSKTLSSTQSDDEEEDCAYFKTDLFDKSNVQYLKFTNFLESFEECHNSNQNIKNFSKRKSKENSEAEVMAPPQLRRKHSSSPYSDTSSSNTNNNDDGLEEEEDDDEEEEDSRMEQVNNVVVNHVTMKKKKKSGRPKKKRLSLSSYDSPGLCDGENFDLPLSPESDVSANSEKIGQGLKDDKSRSRSNQRYSSDDLYKPRPLFSSSSRRNRKSN